MSQADLGKIRLKQNDTVILDIIDYDSKGRGVARHEGCVVFVPFTLIGEQIKARIDYVKKSFATATIIEVINASFYRTMPICNHFGKCGGCDIMHIDYPKQLQLKQNVLSNTLSKYYKKDIIVNPCVKSEDYLAYRNKLMLPFGKRGDKVVVGFYQKNTHKVVATKKCFLHGEWAEKLIAVTTQFATTYKISVYDEKSKKGLLRHLVARYVDNSLSITVVINGKTLPQQEKLVEMLDKVFESYVLYISTNTKDNNVVMGDSLTLVKGEDIKVQVNGIKFSIHPHSFLQINDNIWYKIYKQIITEIIRSKSDTVIDAYAGIGLLGAQLAQNGIFVYNIEIVKEAVNDANKLAQDNQIQNFVKNINGDAQEELPRLAKLFVNCNKHITIILDPPRKGCSETLLNTINNLFCNGKEPSTVNKSIVDKQTDIKDNNVHKQTLISNTSQPKLSLIYISCNPATLARDLALLTSFKVTSITPYDMFPQTQHIETLVCLARK